MLDKYNAYLKSKLIQAKPAGFDPILPIHPIFFDWQVPVVTQAIRVGRYALFEERGLGKTLQQLEWAKHIQHHTKQPVLIVCPLAVAKQTIREGLKLDLDVEYVRSMDDVKMADSPLMIINYDMLKHIEPDRFGGIVLDECFVSDTPVDAKEGTKPIEDIEAGEYVYNATGLSKVIAKKKRYAKSLVLTTIQNRSIISSSNHLFFTRRGWVKAKNLKAGDYVVYTSETMRMVQKGYDTGYSAKESEAFLQSELFSEMENEAAGNFSESSLSRSSGQKGEKKKCLAEVEQSQSEKRDRTYKEFESNIRSGSEKKNIEKVESDGAQTTSAWGEWQTDSETTKDALGNIGGRLGVGICAEFGETTKGISDLLQDRYSQSEIDDSYRGGWVRAYSAETEREGQEEGDKIKGARVDSVTVYESDDPIFTRHRDETGRVALYDLEIENHPSFSVHGLLVHNSSILKNYTGKTKRFIVEQFVPSVSYRLFCSATPAPNDHLELGNHSEGLGVMPSNEMIARWFINSANDPGEMMVAGKYKIKPHGKEDFWRWVATWAACISKPSDIGFSDEGYIRPEVNMKYHILPVDHTRAWTKPDKKGQYSLFLNGVASATAMWQEKSETFEQRCYCAKEIDEELEAQNEYHIIWCDTNEESKLLADLIPDAVEVKGSDKPSDKEAKLDDFSQGNVRAIVTKSKIAGMGLNWQHCAHQTWASVNYKWEEWYQSLGRTDRFGNGRQTTANLILSETENKILEAHERKGGAHAMMQVEMNEIFAKYGAFSVGRRELNLDLGNMKMELPKWLK